MHKIKGGDCRLHYMNQGSYKKEPSWQSKADARLEKWLKQKKEKRRSSERRILLQKNNHKKEGGAM